jgi:hypothetical protein
MCLGVISRRWLTTRRDSTELWYRASAKNVVIFAMMWLGEARFRANWMQHWFTEILGESGESLQYLQYPKTS